MTGKFINGDTDTFIFKGAADEGEYFFGGGGKLGFVDIEGDINFGHFEGVEPFDLVEDEGRAVGGGDEAEIAEGALDVGPVGADSDFDVFGLVFIAGVAVELFEERAGDIVAEVDEFDDFDATTDGIDGKADGTDDFVIFAGDEVVGVMGLEHEEAGAELEVAEDVAAGEAAAGDAEEGGEVTFLHLFDFEVTDGVAVGVIIGNDIVAEAEVFEGELAEEVGFGDDAGVIAAEFTGRAEDIGHKGEAFAVIEEDFLGEEADWLEAKFFRDALGEGVGGAAFGEGEMETGLGEVEAGLHEGGADATAAGVGGDDQPSEFTTKIGIGTDFKVNGGATNDFTIEFGEEG